MTKKEMKEKIEARCVDAWDDMNWCSKHFGSHDNKTVIASSKWVELNRLCIELFNEEPRYQ